MSLKHFYFIGKPFFVKIQRNEINLSSGLFNIFTYIFGSVNFTGLETATEFNKIHQINFEATTVLNDNWSNTTKTYFNQTIARLQPINIFENENDYNDATTILDINCSEDASNENYKVEMYFGDIMVSLILQECENATNTIKFIAKRINELGVLAHHTSIGNLLYIYNTYKQIVIISF